jgi:hypothetical protein
LVCCLCFSNRINSGSLSCFRIHEQAENSDKIVLKAMGRAINKAVTIAEILKRKMPLHQINGLSSVEMIDIFEPLEEGLDRVTSRRYGTLPCAMLRCLVAHLSRYGWIGVIAK